MNLRRIRKAKGLTIAQLAEIVGVDATTVQRAETGYGGSKVETYSRCADALGVTLSDLFAEDLSDDERALIAAYRALPEPRRRVLGDLISLINETPRTAD